MDSLVAWLIRRIGLTYLILINYNDLAEINLYKAAATLYSKLCF